MSREIGAKEKALRAQREANYAARKQPCASVATLKSDVAAIPVKKRKKVKP